MPRTDDDDDGGGFRAKSTGRLRFRFQYLSRNRAHVYLFRHWILSQGPELVAAVAHTWSGADEFRVHEWSGIRHGASGPPIWTVVISVYVPGKATQPGRSTSY
ncbi:hypothetical protein BHM03_00039223 [Ensete ventricosum]|nr:hypothetical protein BHM03_00039223 [Ensete ventricosum]